mmetsp:Transcript_25569/g.30938  ORF Transcript_25569/g.30938 Transcript_25569/m.30938 type:complete len:385 (+) Transcript_25569:17-1171(+)
MTDQNNTCHFVSFDTDFINSALRHCETSSCGKDSFNLCQCIQKLRSVRGHYGHDNVNVLQLLSEIGQLLVKQRHHDFARPFYEEQLRIEMVFLGRNNPELAITLNTIAEICYAQTCYEDAMEYYQCGLNLWRSSNSIKSLTDKSIFARILYNIGKLYNAKRSLEQALYYFKTSISVIKMIQGEFHPDVATLYFDVGTMQMLMGRTNLAMQSFQESLTITQLVFGNSSEKVIETKLQIANIHDARGEHDNALVIYNESLQYMLSTQKIDMQTMATLQKIGQLHHAMGSLDDSVKAYLNLSSISRQILGRRSPYYVFILCILVSIRIQNGEVTKAQSTLQESEVIIKEFQQTSQNDISDEELTLLRDLCHLLCINMFEFAFGAAAA